MPPQQLQIILSNKNENIWGHLYENLNTPWVTLILVIIILIAYWYYNTHQQNKQKPPKTKAILQKWWDREHILKAIEENKEKQIENKTNNEIKDWQQSISQKKQTISVFKSKIKTQQELKKKMNIRIFDSLMYETKEQIQEKNNQLLTQKLKLQKIQQNQKRQKQIKKAEAKRKEQEIKQLREKQLQKKREQQRQNAITNQQIGSAVNNGSNQSLRSNQRKPTIQQFIKPDAFDQKDQINENSSQRDTLLSFTANKIVQPSPNSIVPPSTQTIGSMNFQGSSFNLGNTIQNIAQNPVQNKPIFNNPVPNKPTLLDTLIEDKQKKIILPNSNNPISSFAPNNAQPANIPAQAPQSLASAPQIARNRTTINSEQYLEMYIKYAEGLNLGAQIPTQMSNLGGARSNLNDLLAFAESFFSSIQKTDQNLTTFALKIYDSIVHKLIANSNLKQGLERMPPKSKTNQVQKNSINCYVLVINIYRLMGHQKIWAIIFGKTLKLMQFLFKRKEDIPNYNKLDLIVNKYIQKRGQIAGKYLSRIDYLSYFLFGLTAFDPILIYRQVEQKQRDIRKSRQKLQSLGKQWNYKQFWILTDTFFMNKHNSYFKPIIYMNVLNVLYPRIYQFKSNPQNFKSENELYRIILEKSKNYFQNYRTNSQLIKLTTDDEGPNFQYDGQDFKQGIKVLQSRINLQKTTQFALRAKEFEAKSNILYYFCKQR